MSYLRLFLEFFKIGLFTFGGAYGAIPLIRETVLLNGWLTEEMFSNMLAVSESTPGPIMVNVATYTGNIKGGIFGAMIATIGVVLPSFIIIILISLFLKKYLEKSAVKAVLSGLKPCIAGIILATGIDMAFTAVFRPGEGVNIDVAFLMIMVFLAAISIVYRTKTKKPFSPIMLIGISAVLGIFFMK